MFRRALTSAATAASAAVVILGGATVAAAPADAVVVSRLQGALVWVKQNHSTHALLVNGYAWDPAHKSTSVKITIYVDNHAVKTVRTTVNRPVVNRKFHLTGAHGFNLVIPHASTASIAKLQVHTAYNYDAHKIVDETRPVQVSAGDLVIEEARRYVNRAPYAYGGSSPSGFDCSGFSMYVYSRAGMRTLSHSAQAQRTSRGMHRISRSSARVGDLVFDLSGGYAYHVAIYAGHGRAVAAIQPGRPVGYQTPPSGAVYGSNWH